MKVSFSLIEELGRKIKCLIQTAAQYPKEHRFIFVLSPFSNKVACVMVHGSSAFNICIICIQIIASFYLFI